jgi:hypothetical protein
MLNSVGHTSSDVSVLEAVSKKGPNPATTIWYIMFDRYMIYCEWFVRSAPL